MIEGFKRDALYQLIPRLDGVRSQMLARPKVARQDIAGLAHVPPAHLRKFLVKGTQLPR